MEMGTRLRFHLTCKKRSMTIYCHDYVSSHKAQACSDTEILVYLLDLHLHLHLHLLDGFPYFKMTFGWRSFRFIFVVYWF